MTMKKRKENQFQFKIHSLCKLGPNLQPTPHQLARQCLKVPGAWNLSECTLQKQISATHHRTNAHMCMRIYTYTHTHKHTHARKCVHTHVHMHTHGHTHTHTHTHHTHTTHTDTMRTHTTHICGTHAHTHARTHARTHAHTHAHTHTHTHAHTHTVFGCRQCCTL